MGRDGDLDLLPFWATVASDLKVCGSRFSKESLAPRRELDDIPTNSLSAYLLDIRASVSEDKLAYSIGFVRLEDGLALF